MKCLINHSLTVIYFKAIKMVDISSDFHKLYNILNLYYTNNNYGTLIFSTVGSLINYIKVLFDIDPIQIVDLNDNNLLYHIELIDKKLQESTEKIRQIESGELLMLSIRINRIINFVSSTATYNR